MHRKNKRVVSEIEQKADKIKTLVIEEEQCAQDIRELERKLSELRQKKTRIKDQLHKILNFANSDESEVKELNQKYAIPKTGVVIEMADVMSETEPMTKDEIALALKKRGVDIKENSLRSNLSNMQCFENIKKNALGYNGKKGWICYKWMLKNQ